jgi:hypothetical protein
MLFNKALEIYKTNRVLSIPMSRCFTYSVFSPKPSLLTISPPKVDPPQAEKPVCSLLIYTIQDSTEHIGKWLSIITVSLNHKESPVRKTKGKSNAIYRPSVNNSRNCLPLIPISPSMGRTLL